MHAVVVYLSVRLSVCACVSVTLRYCLKTAKHSITEIMTHDRPGTLVFKWDVCTVVAEFLLTSASCGPSAIAEPLVHTRHRHLVVDRLSSKSLVRVEYQLQGFHGNQAPWYTTFVH